MVDDSLHASKEELWDEIQKCCKQVSSKDIEKLTKSMDTRLIWAIEKQGGYTNY